VFSAEDAEAWVGRGEKVILVRTETSPEDINGMHVSEGILTTRGGMTSHAAVVARGMGIPCVSGAGDLRVDYENKHIMALGETLAEGEILTIDGSTGEVMRGEVATIQPEMTGDFGRIMEWVDGVRTLGIRANAETPLDAETARNFGAEGIGLSRTEHMFFEPARIVHMRQMILATTETVRREALDKLLPYQRQDFLDLFRIMEGLPVTIRLLDPPLNEFLPRMPEGSIVASDELHYLKWPGGTQALLKGAKIGFIEINDSFVEQAEETARHLQNAGLRLRLKCGGDACSQYNQWGARGSA